MSRRSVLALRASLVIQGAICTAILVVAAQFLDRFSAEIAAIRAASIDNIGVVKLRLPVPRYLDPRERRLYFRRVVDAVDPRYASEAGLVSALSSAPAGTISTDLSRLMTAPNATPQFAVAVVDTGYLRTMRARTIMGEMPGRTAFDEGTAKVCLLNASAASLLKGFAEVGSELIIPDFGKEPFSLAAVVEDLADPSEDGPRPTIYVPFSALEMVERYLVWRSSNPLEYRGQIPRVLRELDPSVVISPMERLADLFSPAVSLGSSRLT
jgi:hypothetical protein